MAFTLVVNRYYKTQTGKPKYYCYCNIPLYFTGIIISLMYITELTPKLLATASLAQW